MLQQVDWEIINPQLDEIIEKNKNEPSNLIEVLHQTQEIIGFIPRDAQIKISKGLNVSLSAVNGVVSFYSHFSEKPKGKYQIAICKGTACYVKGSPEIIEKLETDLGIVAGDTTDDGLFSLEIVRCLGACGLGPVMTVNGTAYGLLKPDKAIAILKDYKNKELKQTS
jgi:NADH:ubiquinone oxidoreductase subunit E